jgi:CRP/FNR family cyclic AMP-dependent transcriptional regulator
MTIATPQQRSLAEKVGLLREIDLFQGLSDDDIEAIGHATTMTHCSVGQRIMSPDDPPERIHILKKGKVRVYRVTPDGKQLTLDIYDKGTILGDMSLLGQEPIPEAFAETLDEAVICTISPDEMRQLVERYPAIGVNIISYLSRRLRDAESELESMAYQRVGQRLARKLIDLSTRFGVKTPRGTLIEARLTQQELAEMIGTTRETLAHTLADFRRRGLLDTEKHQVLIRDAQQLMDIAEGLEDLDD